MDNRIFATKFEQMREEDRHYYKKSYIYIISQDPATLESDVPYFKVGLTNDNILRRFGDYQTCFREFLVYGLFEFPLKDVKKAETAIHKQIPNTVYYKKYVTAGTEYIEMERVKTKNGYVTRELGKLVANKDMLVDDFKKATEWVSCPLGEIYDAIDIVLKNNPALNSLTGYKMSETKITELKAFNMKQLDDSVYYSVRTGRTHKKTNNTTLQFHKGSFYNVINDKNNKVTKKKVVSKKFPVVMVDGEKLGFGNDHPAKVKKVFNSMEGKVYDVYYFGENTMDTVFPSQTKPFTKALYKELSKTADTPLQSALDEAYEYLYDVKASR